MKEELKANFIPLIATLFGVLTLVLTIWVIPDNKLILGLSCLVSSLLNYMSYKKTENKLFLYSAIIWIINIFMNFI